MQGAMWVESTAIIYDKKNLVIFSFPGMITSVFMSLLLDISYLKRISM